MSDQTSTLDALRDLSSPRALVVRDGEEVRIPGREVVRGDVVLLGEGDRVPADALLVRAASLATAVLLLVAVLGVPGLRTALGFGPLDIGVVLVAGAAASAGILWFEGWKAVSRRRA